MYVLNRAHVLFSKHSEMVLCVCAKRRTLGGDKTDFGDAEVAELDGCVFVALVGEEDVGCLDVAMQDLAADRVCICTYVSA